MDKHENTNISQFKPIISPAIIKDELPIDKNMMLQVIEYRNIDGSTDSVKIDTDDITFTLDQYSRNRSIAEYTLVKKI